MILKHRYVIAVHDLKKSASFYEKILGFTVHKIDDPGWLFLKKDDCLIMVGECKDAIAPNDLGDHSYFAYLEVADIDRYYSEIQSKGGQPKYAPENKTWGMREFPIETIDGHRIMIGQTLNFVL